MRLASCQPRGMKREDLIKAREAAGLSQDELASAAGVTRWTINRIEVGERNPSFDLMQKIIAALGGGVSADIFTPLEAPAPARENARDPATAEASE